MRRNILSVTFCVLMSVFIITGWGLFIWQGRESAEVAATNGDLIRLHVLASSDSAADQAVKLQVRDAVIAYLTPYFAGIHSADAAHQIIENHKPELLAVAQSVVNKSSHPYGVQIETGVFQFPIKSYGNLVLPAGKYEAVRILLGEAQGKNWWCVLFPPLCFVDGTQATAVPAMVKQVGSGDHERRSVEFRWKIAEWWKLRTE